MKPKIMAALAVALLAVAHPAEARPKHPHHDSETARGCVYGNTAVVVCPGGEARASGPMRGAARHVGWPVREAVRIIPHPAGCPHVRFCACGLAKLWRLGSGLNLVATWPKVFPLAHGPGVGLAAVRADRHHVLGIVSGAPGAWEVVDFNSGNHLSRRYVVASFPGYFFVDPRARTASR